MDSKPSWDDAPEWAEYLAMDHDNTWWWFEKMPDLDNGTWMPTNNRYTGAYCYEVRFEKSLEKRPNE